MIIGKAKRGICNDGILKYVYGMDWFEIGFHLAFIGLTPEIHPNTCKQGPQRCLSMWMNLEMLVAYL